MEEFLGGFFSLARPPLPCLKLATIITDVPINIDWEKLKLTKIQNEKALAILKKLGFKSLVKRLQVPQEKKPKCKKDKQLGLFAQS